MAEVIHIKTNPEVLKWARVSLMLSKPKAAKGIRISISRLEQLENGERFPSMGELKSMAKTYNRTVATLLLQKPPEEKPLPKDRRTIDSVKLDIFHEKTIMAVRKARALVSSLIELKEEVGLPIQPFQFSGSIEDSPVAIAHKLRIEWKLDEFKQIFFALIPYTMFTGKNTL